MGYAGCARALGRWGDAVVEQYPLHRVPTDVVAEVGQGTADPRVAPSRILDGHPHNQLGTHLRRQRPTATATGTAVVLLGNQSPIPTQNGVRCDDASYLRQDPSAEFLPAYGKTPALRSS